MANEVRGILCEAIAEVALQKAVEIAGIPGTVRWNEKPEGMSIKPDFTIGEDPNAPSHVVLVTASGSSSNSHMKFARNLGEMYEIKAQLPQSAIIVNIYFISEVKEDLIGVSQQIYDVAFYVDQQPYYEPIKHWIDSNVTINGKSKEEKLQALAQQILSSNELTGAINSLTEDLAIFLQQRNQDLDPLWVLMREDYEKPNNPPTAKNTSVRRGLGKLMVLEQELRQQFYAGETINPDDVPEYPFELGLLRKTVAGIQIADPEIKGALELLGNETCEIILQKAPASMSTWIEPLRNLGNIKLFADYVVSNYNQLTNPSWMKSCIESQHSNPYDGLDTNKISGNLTTAWIFDFIGALEKAKNKSSTSFGFAYFGQHSLANREQIGNMNIGTWCSCFMNQYFNRLPDFTPPGDAIQYVAELLAEKLQEFSPTSIQKLVIALKEVYINTNLEKKLIPYRNFEPLLWLLEAELQKQSKAYEPKTAYVGWVNEYAEVGKRSATTPFVKVGTTLIHWKSSYASHPNDKTKELSVRARSVKYQYHVNTKTFTRRSGISQLALIVDGDWKDRHLQTLTSSGWDIIVYPDEIAQLVSQL